MVNGDWVTMDPESSREPTEENPVEYTLRMWGYRTDWSCWAGSAEEALEKGREATAQILGRLLGRRGGW